MPTPPYHGGAQLQRIPLNTPGFRGLNTQQASGLLGPEWATVLQNAVIDDNGRVAARKGWDSLTSTPAAASFVQGIEHLKANGNVEIILSTATALYQTSSGSSFSAVTGTASFTDGNWQFLNFNDELYGVQAGKAPIRYTTAGGSFAHLVDGNAPTGGVGLAAFGRLWIVASDGVTIRYSALLDGTDWTSADSGQISVAAIWPGTDHVVALAAFNGSLVVFGKDNILFWTDGQGSVLGVDPTQLFVGDTLSGIGCYARDTVQNVAGDLWFMSRVGLQSLGRLINERSNPINNLSLNVQDSLKAAVQGSTAADIRSLYSPEKRLYLLSLNGSSESGITYAFDTRALMEDGAARCVGTWTGLAPLVMIRRQDGSIWMSRYGNTGEIGAYQGNLDDTAQYVFDYESGWIDITQAGYTIIPKKIDGVFYMDNTASLTFKWAFDFEDNFYTASQSVGFEGGAAGEWGLGEWGLSEFGGGIALDTSKVAGKGTGQYIKLGLTVPINNVQFAVQNLNMYAKIGRLA